MKSDLTSEKAQLSDDVKNAETTEVVKKSLSQSGLLYSTVGIVELAIGTMENRTII